MTLHEALLGMTFATLILYAAKLVYFTTDPTDQPLGNRLRAIAWAIVSGAVIIGFSPPRIASLLGHPLPAGWNDSLLLLGLTLLVSAACVWTAGRGFLRGGTNKDVMQGLIANLLLVSLSLLAVVVVN